MSKMLKKFLPIFIAAISVFAASASTSGVRWDKRWDASSKTLVANQGDRAADWMADLPDNMFVAHVSIPGAHDFATGEGKWVTKSAGTGPVNSTCQSATMDELLAGGLRGLDIRPGCFKPVFGKRKLYLCHGTDIIDVEFITGMVKLADYLTKHSTEFFVMHIFRGNNGDNPDEANSFYNEALNDTRVAGHIVEFRPNLTVREARGKIVIVVRDRASYLQNDKQADIQNWRTSFNDDQRPGRLNLHSDANVTTRLHVQDISSTDEGSMDTKQAQMLNLIEYSQAQDEPMKMYGLNGLYISEWVMNFASMQTSSISLSSNYKSNATTLNAKLVDDLEAGRLGAGPLGVVFMDYCLNSDTNGDRAVYKVIENNFTGGENAPVVRYQIDESIDWRRRPENPLAGKRIYLRNVGASEDVNYYKYFGGGANWGAHAIANYAGHYVTFEQGDNGLRLVSVFGALQNKDGQYYCDPADGDNNNATEFLLTRTYWDGYPVYHITGQVSQKRLTAVSLDGDNPYYDSPAYYVSPCDPDDSDPHQMWQLIAMTPDDEVPLYTISGYDRISRLKQKANRERGMDATFLIPSYSFGNSDSSISDWTVNAGSNVTAGRAADDHGAMWRAFNTSASNSTFSISTIVPNLPKGSYKLEFQYASTSSDVKFRLGDREAVTLEANAAQISGLTAGSDQISLAGNYFNASVDNGRIVYEFYKETDETSTRELTFFRDGNADGAASFYLDNIRLTYYGDNVEPTVIELTFPEEWNTVILPFDHEIPDGLEVCEAVGVTGTAMEQFADGTTIDYHVIFYSSPVASIRANYPYLVRNKALVDERAGRSAAPSRVSAAERVYTFTGYPTNRKNDYHDIAGVLTGLTEPRGLSPESLGYPLTGGSSADGTYRQYFDRPDAAGDDINHEGRRAYLNGRTATNVVGQRVYFDRDMLTGVEDIDSDRVSGTDLVDVIDVAGTVLRSGVMRSEALEGLPAGVYIIDGPEGVSKEIHR